MTKKIKHGIIGCGRIAENHINACKNNNFEVSFCCDLDIEKAKGFANQHGIKYYTNDYIEIIDFPEIESVSICTDHLSHTKIAADLAIYKHLIIEKPLSSNYLDAKIFLEYIKSSSKIISVISQHRFDEVVEFTKNMLEINAFGKVSLVNIHLKCNKQKDYYSQSYWRGSNKYEGGSTVINQSFHLLDILTYFFGIPVETKSYLSNYKFEDVIETEDTCTAILKYENFLCCFSTTNTSVTEWSTFFEIIGDEGEISFTLDFPEKLINISTNQHLHNNYKFQINKIAQNYINNEKANAGYFGLSHISQFSNFRNAILGNENIKISVSDVLKTQKLINMIYSK